MIELNYEPFLARIEVHSRKLSDDELEPPSWRVRVVQHEETILTLSGFLKIAVEGGSGRALVHGVVWPRDDEDVLPEIDLLLQSANVEGCVEAMWDVARRSLNVQAAMMDFAFDLPNGSPDVPIHPKRRAPEPA